MSSFLVATYELILQPEIYTSFKNLCCDLKFSHHNYIHSYSGCNLDSLLRPRKFPGLLEQLNSQQVQFTKSNQNKYNSIHIHHSNIQRIHSAMHQIKNLSTKINKNFPQTFNHAISETKFNKSEKNILPPFVSCADWKFECRASSLCTLLLSCKKHT